MAGSGRSPCTRPEAPAAGRLSRLWRQLGTVVSRNRFVIVVASLIWLVWRSGSQPRRLSYPCQQAAAANLGCLAVLFVPGLVRWWRSEARRAGQAGNLATGSVALAGVLFVLIGAGVAVFSNAGDDYTPGTPAIVPWTPVDLSVPTAMSSELLTPSGDEGVVAINRNPSVTYGVQPYGPGTNTAYELTWQTVADLHLGPYANPLANLVKDVDGDGTIEVVIKPNTVRYFSDDAGQRNPVYSHPAIVRPLVDMLAAAGAQSICIGDGSNGTGGLFAKMDQQGYTQAYIDQLNALWPGTTISRVDFQSLSRWSWVNLGAHAGEAGASAYYGSGYSDADLVKSVDGAASTYFGASDPHGRPGPGQYNCMGWEAVTDYLLDADVVIDLAKLKVHYYGVSTAILKNWVGITMFSTFNMSENYWCRIAHEPTNPTSYEKTFGNDILWREVTDLHRGVLYWRDGAVYSTPQRRCLCILDAINCGERYHDPDKPWPYWLHTMLAGVDPISIDAVGARLQRYDFRNIAIINNAHAASAGSAWPIGTGDPGQVRVVGGQMIDGTYSHQFLFDDRHGPDWPDWGTTVINDLTPPTINAATIQEAGGGNWIVQANISGAHVAFVYYGDDGAGAPKVMRLAKNGDDYTATVSGPPGEAYVTAQDGYFNTARAAIVNLPVIGLSTGAIDRSTHFGENVVPGDTFTVRNLGAGTLTYSIRVDQTWLSVTPTDGSSTGEEDPIAVSYDCAGLAAGLHTALITVTGNAINDPKTITATVVIETVKPDFNGDGDVDQEDFGHLQECLSGSAAYPAGCENADLDGNDLVDQTDYSILQGCMSGPKVTADPSCAD